MIVQVCSLLKLQLKRSYETLKISHNTIRPWADSMKITTVSMRIIASSRISTRALMLLVAFSGKTLR